VKKPAKEIVEYVPVGSVELCKTFRSYNKINGWPMAHEAVDIIEALEKENELLKLKLSYIEESTKYISNFLA
jgi:hypothetical protein